MVNMIFNWSCDGASGQHAYKQQYSHKPDDVDGSYIFIVWVVLQMSTISSSGNKEN